MEDAAIIRDMEKWSIDVVEKPNPAFGNLPICPFAKKARLEGKIRWEVRQHDIGGPVEPLMALLRSFDCIRYDIMMIVSPVAHPSEHDFFAYVDEMIKPGVAKMGIDFLGAHPESEWRIGDWVTRWPYQTFLVSTLTLLKTSSDKLLKTKYYSQWTKDQMEYFGLPRRK